MLAGSWTAPVRRLLGDRRVAYAVVGAINAVLFIGFFWVSLRLLRSHIGYLPCMVISYAVSIFTAFWLHRSFVFKVRGQVLTDLWRFIVVNLGSLGVNVVSLPFFVEVVGISVLPAQVLSTVISVVLNYVGHLFFSFRRRADPGEPTVPLAAAGADQP